MLKFGSRKMNAKLSQNILGQLQMAECLRKPFRLCLGRKKASEADCLNF